MEWKTLLFTLGPLLGPKIYQYAVIFYRDLRHASSRPTVRPLPTSASRALNILFLSVLASLALSLPHFAPENVFALTQARLQTNNDVLFTRLAALRPSSTLTDSDVQLKKRLQTRDGRLFYLQYGHDALANCAFCATANPTTFTAYVLPALLAPHLFHLVVIGLATTRTLAGSDAARWRGYATLAALIAAASELYLTMTYSHATNLMATRATDFDAFHWRMRTLRYIGLAAMDAVLAAAIWLSATRRFFVTSLPPLPEAIEQAAGVAAMLEAQSAKLSSLGALRNTMLRDRRLRERFECYWLQERVLREEVEQEKDVLEGVNAAVVGLDMELVERQAGDVAAAIMSSTRIRAA